MRLTWQSCLLMALSVLLICSSAAPVHPKDTDNKGITEPHQLVSRQPFTLFGIDLKPRFPLRLGGGRGGFLKPKPKPKPAPAPVTDNKPESAPQAPPKPAPAASKPAPAASKPAPAASAVSKPAPSKSVPTTQATTSQSLKPSATSSQSSPSISSSGSILASSQSTGSVSSSKSSSSQSSSTSSGEQVQATRDPQDVSKCNKNGCSGTTCSIKAPKGKGGKGTTPKGKTPKGKGARDIESSVDLALRDFRLVNDNGNLADFPTDEFNEDISTADHTESPFMRFDAENPQTVRVQGLSGCTVVAAVSAQGMIATHLFEHGDQPIRGGRGKVRPDIDNTLHPNAFRATLARAGALLGAHKGDLTGGRLVIMMPVNADGGQRKGQFRYDTETWPAIGKRDHNTFTTGRVKGTGIREAIVQMAQDATGLQADVATYEVGTRDRVPEPPVEAVVRTFVMQYDPNNDPNSAQAAGAQVFIEGNERFQPVFHFATPAAAEPEGQ